MVTERHCSEPSPLFEARIVPHRSLSPKGVRIVLGVILGFSLLIALRCYCIGAWPVVGFSMAESSLVLTLMAMNIRRAKGSELVRLTEAAVHVTRTTASGVDSEVVLPAAWLRVDLQERAGRVPRLVLRTPREREEIANAVGEAARRDLADALGSALHEARNPQFDNPQLRG
jgi:uncharacterized membrane protein